MKKSKILLTIIVSAVVLALTFSFVSCKKDNNPTGQKMNIQEIYSKNIVASLGLLNNSMQESKVNLAGRRLASRQLLAENVPNIDFDELTEFVKGISSLVQDMENKFVIETSDKAEYETKITYHGQSIDGNDELYVIYYNETPVNQAQDDDDDDDDKYDKDNDNLDEVETTLRGVAYVGTNEYQVTGSKKIEKDEVEIELQIRFDQQNYVEICQEKENGEVEYEYEIVKNGNTVREFGLEFKTKNERTVIEIEEEVNGTERKIEIEGTANSNKLKIEVEINDTKQEFTCETFTKESGEIGYRFTNLETNQVVEK